MAFCGPSFKALTAVKRVSYFKWADLNQQMFNSLSTLLSTQSLLVLPFVRGNITVQMTYWLKGLELTKQVDLLFNQHKQSS